MNTRTFAALFKDTASAWLEDYPSRFGAALAYYAVFSLAPLAVIGVGIAGLVFGREAARQSVVHEARHLVGEGGTQAVQAMLDSACSPKAGILAGVLGIAMLFFGAAGLFGQLQDALNSIWRMEPRGSRGIRGFLRDRLVSIIMVIVVALLLLVSLVMSAVFAGVLQFLGAWKITLFGHLANELVSLIIFTILFAMVFKVLPEAAIAWRDVWLGAAVTAVLFEIGKFLIGLYLGHVSVASAYGASGSLAVLLLWFYYSSQVFLFGAEFTKVYANQFGSRILSQQAETSWGMRRGA